MSTRYSCNAPIPGGMHADKRYAFSTMTCDNWHLSPVFPNMDTNDAVTRICKYCRWVHKVELTTPIKGIANELAAMVKIIEEERQERSYI